MRYMDLKQQMRHLYSNVVAKTPIRVVWGHAAGWHSQMKGVVYIANRECRIGYAGISPQQWIQPFLLEKKDRQEIPSRSLRLCSAAFVVRAQQETSPLVRK